MTDRWLLAFNIVLWLSAAFIVGTLYATHSDLEANPPSDYRIAVTERLAI